MRKSFHRAAIALGIATSLPAVAQTQGALAVKDGNGGIQSLCNVASTSGSVEVPCSNLYVLGAQVSAANPVPTVIAGSLPAFIATPTFNVGSAPNLTIGSLPPLAAGTNAIGSITNTSFAINGTLPAFAATPTVNIGTAPTFTVTGSVITTPLGSSPVAYTSGTVVDMRNYGSVILTCTAAPSAGSLSVSPDNASGYIVQTLVLNNSSGVTSTTAISSAGVYNVAGHQYVKAALTGGTCFIAGGQ